MSSTGLLGVVYREADATDVWSWRRPLSTSKLGPVAALASSQKSMGIEVWKGKWRTVGSHFAPNASAHQILDASFPAGSRGPIRFSFRNDGCHHKQRKTTTMHSYEYSNDLIVCSPGARQGMLREASPPRRLQCGARSASFSRLFHGQPLILELFGFPKTETVENFSTRTYFRKNPRT